MRRENLKEEDALHGRRVVGAKISEVMLFLYGRVRTVCCLPAPLKPSQTHLPTIPINTSPPRPPTHTMPRVTPPPHAPQHTQCHVCMQVCVFCAPIFAGNTAIASYLLTTEVTKRSAAGLVRVCVVCVCVCVLACHRGCVCFCFCLWGAIVCVGVTRVCMPVERRGCTTRACMCTCIHLYAQ